MRGCQPSSIPLVYPGLCGSHMFCTRCPCDSGSRSAQSHGTFPDQNLPKTARLIEVPPQACFTIAAQEQKKRIEDMIAEEATIDGMENVECKVFK